MISLDQPLDPTTPEGQAFLATIQGNILKSHGRNYQNQVFITFGQNSAAARAWLAGFSKRVTSAQAQWEQTQAFKAAKGADPGELFCAIALSYTGYRALGVAEDRIPQDPKSLIGLDYDYFKNGMKAFASSPLPYMDPFVDDWEAPYQGNLDAMVTLAHGDPARLPGPTQALLTELAGAGFQAFVERGVQLTHDFHPRSNVPIEHFGFEDGISDPYTLTTDIKERCENDGCRIWTPQAPLSLLLLAEPGPPPPPGGEANYGSFILFRKLEQNVFAFNDHLKRLADSLGETVDRVGAMAVGRHRNGVPAGNYSAPPRPAPGTPEHPADGHPNDFDYSQDLAGTQCPFQAHLRKSNPRGTSPMRDLDLMFRIARRGITYGERPDREDDSPAPSKGVGLLFMSHQARNEQFAIQQNGADDNNFVQSGTGVDAVNGRNVVPHPQEWPIGSGRRFTMANFVRMLGGEYFFAPSMAFLKSFGDGA